MLKGDIEWPETRSYDTGTEWEPVGFFSDCLCNSTSFDLMLGFFASSAISVLSDGFATFLYNGGKMRLIINDILSDEDKDAIQKGVGDSFVPAFNLSDIEALKTTLSERDRHFFDCLSWLIRNNRIEIKVIAPNEGTGISHPKCGVFSDGENSVSFTGSCNFSRSALVDNIEQLTASCDWDMGPEAAKVRHRVDSFEKAFNGEGNYKYLSTSDIKTRIVSAFGDKELSDLLKQEQDLIAKRVSSTKLSSTIKKSLLKAKLKVSSIIDAVNEEKVKHITENITPCFPYTAGPRPYQQEAFERWKDNRQKGFFNMATGTGKTITSLNCLLEIYKSRMYYKALILVPSVTLVDQWEKECRKFNFTNIYKVYSKNPSWRDEIDNILLMEKVQQGKQTEDKLSYVIISTYSSFVLPSAFDKLKRLPESKLLLIADEAHNMGAGSMRRRMKEVRYARRIGLSATPNRQFDDKWAGDFSSFFGLKTPTDYTFEYTMRQAIDNGVLCHYLYYPHVIELTDIEMDQYKEISKRILKYYNPQTESLKQDPILTALLIKRKRIIHKAVNKLKVFKDIIADRLETNGNLKYSLIYVPEGNQSDFEDYDIDNLIEEDCDSEHLIDNYTAMIKEAGEKITVRKFVAGSSERDSILTDFADGQIDVLTSMKCLDEGVDVPRSEFAVFCSSTGNPRQFIQRRGRILRTHKDKTFAIIHDLIVVPKAMDDTSIALERSLLKGELLRVKDFAMLADNTTESIKALENVMDYYQLNLYNN